MVEAQALGPDDSLAGGEGQFLHLSGPQFSSLQKISGSCHS